MVCCVVLCCTVLIYYYIIMILFCWNHQSISFSFFFFCQRVGGGPSEKSVEYIGNTIKQVQHICSVHIISFHSLFFFFLVRLYLFVRAFNEEEGRIDVSLYNNMYLVSSMYVYVLCDRWPFLVFSATYLFFFFFYYVELVNTYSNLLLLLLRLLHCDVVCTQK